MQFWLKVMLTIAILMAQIGLIAWSRWTSISTLRRFMRYRGEDLSPTLRTVGEQLRGEPSSLRHQATLAAVFISFAGSALLVLIWRN